MQLRAFRLDASMRFCHIYQSRSSRDLSLIFPCPKVSLTSLCISVFSLVDLPVPPRIRKSPCSSHTCIRHLLSAHPTDPNIAVQSRSSFLWLVLVRAALRKVPNRNPPTPFVSSEPDTVLTASEKRPNVFSPTLHFLLNKAPPLQCPTRRI